MMDEEQHVHLYYHNDHQQQQQQHQHHVTYYRYNSTHMIQSYNIIMTLVNIIDIDIYLHPPHDISSSSSNSNNNHHLHHPTNTSIQC